MRRRSASMASASLRRCLSAVMSSTVAIMRPLLVGSSVAMIRTGKLVPSRCRLVVSVATVAPCRTRFTMLDGCPGLFGHEEGGWIPDQPRGSVAVDQLRPPVDLQDYRRGDCQVGDETTDRHVL